MIHSETFNEVLSLVKEGLPLSKALEKLDINRQWFYHHASTQQKKIIQFEKAAHTRYCSGDKGSKYSQYKELDYLIRNI